MQILLALTLLLATAWGQTDQLCEMDLEMSVPDSECFQTVPSSGTSWEECRNDCMSDPSCVGIQTDGSWTHCEKVLDKDDCSLGTKTLYPKQCGSSELDFGGYRCGNTAMAVNFDIPASATTDLEDTSWCLEKCEEEASNIGQSGCCQMFAYQQCSYYPGAAREVAEGFAFGAYSAKDITVGDDNSGESGGAATTRSPTSSDDVAASDDGSANNTGSAVSTFVLALLICFGVCIVISLCCRFCCIQKYTSVKYPKKTDEDRSPQTQKADEGMTVIPVNTQPIAKNNDAPPAWTPNVNQGSTPAAPPAWSQPEQHVPSAPVASEGMVTAPPKYEDLHEPQKRQPTAPPADDGTNFNPGAFQVGQKVKGKEYDWSEWKDGVVTSIDPFKVQAEGFLFGTANWHAVLPN